MNYSVIVVLVAVSSVLGVVIEDSAFAQTDSVDDIEFIQTGMVYTEDHLFHISNDLSIREFFSGNIIRISGQTIEGFPYVVYSVIQNNEEGKNTIKTRGMIFINGEFTDLSFKEKTNLQENNIKENNKKDDNITILAKYTQRVYAKQVAQIEIKTFDKEQNKLNNFNQNYGQISDVKTSVKITDEQNQVIHLSNGTTNEFGFFETELLIADNSRRESLTVEIIAENEDSRSSKILQIFSLGIRPNNDS